MSKMIPSRRRKSVGEDQLGKKRSKRRAILMTMSMLDSPLMTSFRFSQPDLHDETRDDGPTNIFGCYGRKSVLPLT